MDKIKCYIDCSISVSICNFRCSYCHVAQHNDFGNAYKPFQYPVEHIAKAFSPKRFGGICFINLCGNGETLIHPQVIPLTKLLLQDGHYVSLVTNGTITNPLTEISDWPINLRERIFIKFSFHYTELMKFNLLDVFFSNISAVKAAGISFTVELVASDESIPYIDEIKDVCMDKLGAFCHATDPRDHRQEGLPRLTQMELAEHQKVWGQFDSALFDYRQTTWGASRKCEFCYSGEWLVVVNLTSGMLRQCYLGSMQMVFDDINEPIHFTAVGTHCPYPHCYNSHVRDCFVGVIPHISSPTYAELRNRVCTDGSEWLTEKYKEVFGKRICENNQEYDEDRKIFTNGMMTLLHREDEPDASFALIVERYLLELGIKSPIFYAENRVTEWLTQQINTAVPFWDNLADSIIVTDSKDIVAIRKKLEKETKLPIIDIWDLPVKRSTHA